MDDTITRAEHEEFSKRVDDEQNRQNHRLTELEQTTREINALTVSVSKLAQSIEQMCKEQEKQGARLEALEGRDGEMWRTVVKYAITIIVSAVVGFALAQIGL